MPITDVIQELMIVKGLPKAIIETSNSAEQGLVSIDLMTQGQQSGWSLDLENGWNPIIPALKGGGVWADSAVSSGRQLLSNEEANVVETMHLMVTGDTAVDLATHMLRMGRMIQDARDFWATHWQIEPVYLRWFAKGAPGPQYALIYNIEMAIVEPDTYSDHIRDVTITVEREPYWRPIPPGANPKVWSAEFRDNEITVEDDLWIAARNLTHANARNDLFKTNELDNRREWNVGQTALISQNYVDIPAVDVPGDAPALVCIGIEKTTLPAASRWMIGRQSKSTTLPGRNGTNNQSVLVLNAGDNASLGTDATLQADTGAPASNNQATGQRGRVTFATATMQPRFTWRAGTGGTMAESRIEATLERGLYAVYGRARLSASGTVQLQLQYGLGDLTNAILNSVVNLTDTGAGGTGNTTAWGLIYLGTVRIPADNRRLSVGLDGKGVLVLASNTRENNLSIILRAARTSGTPDLYVSDLILMPFDEATVTLQYTSVGSMGINAVVYDNTGYFLHGGLEDYAGFWALTANSGDDEAGEDEAIEIEGGRLTLQPGVNNRLHFLHFYNTPGTLRSNVTDGDFQVYINIVPRWRFVRDV